MNRNVSLALITLVFLAGCGVFRQTEDLSEQPDQIEIISMTPLPPITLDKNLFGLKPFNPTTEIRYQIPDAAWVKFSVFDILNREVALLVDERKPAGAYTARVDGRGLSTGVYFYRLEATGQRGRHLETRKMLLLQ